MNASMKMQLLLVSMVLVVVLTTITLLFYSVLLNSLIPITPKLAIYKAVKLKQENEYQVLVGSAIESQFYTLVVHNCTSNVTLTHVQWNNNYWQKVGDSRIYLYSSFYDARYIYSSMQYHYVRVIGMSLGKIQENESYFCNMWYKEMQDPIVVEADASEVWMPLWNRRPDPKTYHTYLFTCPVPLKLRDSHLYPNFVSLSSRACDNVTTKLPIQKEGFSEFVHRKIKKKYAVCVKGMDFEDDLSLKIIEWLELLYILGADKVFIYKYMVHRNVEKVLDYYENEGKVKVLPLTLPGEQPNEPKLRSLYLKKSTWQKRRNELVPYNDCLYRNVYLYDYVIPLDIDEVVIPVKDYTWSDMFETFQREKPHAFAKYASFSAQNAYFLDVFNITYNPKVPEYFHMVHRTIRSANFSIFGHSVKSFVSTKNSRTVFNHYALQPLYSSMKTNMVLNTSLVQMNHYKKRCPRELYSQCKSKFLRYTVRDNIIDKYVKELLFKVEAAIQNIKILV